MKIEDQWLVVDTTWDDIESPNRYRWMNQPTSIAYREREEFNAFVKTLSTEFIGDTIEQKWFYRNGYYASWEDLLNVITGHIGNGEKNFDVFAEPLTKKEAESIVRAFYAEFDEKRVLFYGDGIFRYGNMLIIVNNYYIVVRMRIKR